MMILEGPERLLRLAGSTKEVRFMATIFRDSSVELRRPPLGLERLRLRRTPPPAKPPAKIDLVSVLVSKHGVPEDVALGFLSMLERVRAGAPQPYILNHRELRQFHGVLKVSIPARSKAEAGSTHELINRVMLEQGLSFQHGMTADQCSVVISCV